MVCLWPDSPCRRCRHKFQHFSAAPDHNFWCALLRIFRLAGDAHGVHEVVGSGDQRLYHRHLAAADHRQLTDDWPRNHRGVSRAHL
ncbi:zinc finger domain-containing protein [Acidovorax facilis]